MDEFRRKRWFRLPSLAVFFQCTQRTSYGTPAQLCRLGCLCSDREQPKKDRKSRQLPLHNLQKISTIKTIERCQLKASTDTPISLHNAPEPRRLCELALSERCTFGAAPCSMAMTSTCGGCVRVPRSDEHGSCDVTMIHFC